MDKVKRIRRNLLSEMDRYVVCDADGRPQYTYYDKKDMESGVKSWKKQGYTVLIEMDRLPYLEDLPGSSDTERLDKAIKKWKNTNRLNRIFGYARVSTAGQAREGNSLESQRERLYDAGVEEIYVDVYTGKTTKRPQMEALKEVLIEGDTLIVTRLDRLARTVSEGLALVEELSARGVKIKILSGDMTIDRSPMGKMVLTVLLAVAEMERSLIIERTQEGKAVARQQQGFREGRPRAYSQAQLDHAMVLLQDHSYNQVSEMTGISRATLGREKKKRRQCQY